MTDDEVVARVAGRMTHDLQLPPGSFPQSVSKAEGFLRGLMGAMRDAVERNQEPNSDDSAREK